MLFDSKGKIYGPFGNKTSMPYCPNNEHIGYVYLAFLSKIKSSCSNIQQFI